MELKTFDWGLILWTAFWMLFWGLAIFLIIRFMIRQLKK